MKKINVITVGLIISLFTFITCKQDRIDPPPSPPPPPTPINKPPVAKAGMDTSITLTTCNSIGNLVLDGSASFDPEGFSIAYLWTFLSGPNASNAYINESRTSRPAITKLRAGQYNIELTVTDPGKLYAKDTIMINVIGSTANGYDLDITMNGTFQFDNNYEDCYYCYNPCCYYDISSINNATGSFSPIGNLLFYIYEVADTAATSNPHYSYFGLYGPNSDQSAYGTISVNFKKVFQSGGGSFNGTLTPTSGSALNCDPNIFKNLAPLTVTGNLNTTTNIITLNIKGKIYF